LRQLGHDHRTLALLFVVPVVLLGLLAWLYNEAPHVFDMIGASLLGIFPFIIMFLVTSIATLRERSGGTLERLLVMPIGKLDIIVGYALTFGLLAVVQGVIASTFAVRVYGLDVAGPEWMLVLIAAADAVLGTMLGLLASAFARTEFQAVQFMPAFVLPQLLLCGLLVPTDNMPGFLEGVSNFLPLTYAVDAMTHVTRETTISGNTLQDLAIVLAFAIAAVILGAITLKRKTK
jgi:ABC-2 type transport system permease protein